MEFSIPAGLVNDFHFLRPIWLLALLPVALFFIALWRVNTSLTAWDKAIDQSLLPFLLDRSKNASQRTPLLLLLTVWCLSVVALAGPVWEKLPQPVQKREDALVIVLDLSLSMFAADHTPSRVDLAKRKLRDILDLRDEGQTALVVYAGDAHAVTPLTDDTVTIAALVPSLSPNIMPLFGSNPTAAISIALGLLSDIEASRGKILLMTDGINGFEDEQRITDLLQDSNYELLVMGIGTEQGAPIRTSDGGFLTDNAGQQVIATLNRNVLQTLANRNSGKYHDIQLADSDLIHLLTDINILDDENLSEVEEEFDVWHEAGPWLLLLVLPLAALCFRRGWLFSMALLLGSTTMLPPQQAQALDWQSLWKTKNQQGAAAFAVEDHTTASLLFESPDWQGSAAYRAEDYESAVAAFSTGATADSHYNRGNALAFSGSYPEAIAAYDQALSINPDHSDAIHNKEIVEQLLEQEDSESGEEQDGDTQDEQSQENSESESENQEEQNDQQDQESQEGNQDQEQQEQQENAPPEEQEGSESNSEQNTPSETSNEEFEEQQALEQWLRRIEDDPGELLRRKFRYQYRQRQLNGTSNNLRAGGQIW